MKELFSRLVAAVFDLRLIVAFVGTVLSVVFHELFHILVHWGDITSVHIFPNHEAIAAVHFIPSGEYDLLFEEALAYMITMVTMLLTAKLVAELHDSRDNKSVSEVIFGKSEAYEHSGSTEPVDMHYLARLVGLKPDEA